MKPKDNAGRLERRVRLVGSETKKETLHSDSLDSLTEGWPEHLNDGYDPAALCMFLAGTTRSASPISSFNIHRPTNNLPKESTYSKNLLFEYAKLLEYDEKNMIAIYTERTLMSETDARQFMEQGTVLTPSEAVTIGVISVIEMFGPPFGEAVQTIGM